MFCGGLRLTSHIINDYVMLCYGIHSGQTVKSEEGGR